MSTLGSVILEGLASALPAASIPGRLYLATDTNTVYRDNGTAWVADIVGGGSFVENITLFIDGAGSAITTGQKAFTSVPYNCTIQSVTLLADRTGSVVADVWKTTYSAYAPGTHPVVGDSITAADQPTITSAAKSTDSTLTGWTTAITAGDILQFVINSAATIQKLMLVLTVERT